MSIRFKLCAELSDGEHWSVVSDPKLVAQLVEEWARSALHYGAGEQVSIELVDMTDAEVEALPDL